MGSISDDTIDSAIAAWIRDAVPGETILNVETGRLLHRIDLHGVGAMLGTISDLSDLPGTLASALRQRRIESELWEAQHMRILAEALEVLQRADLDPIIMKGTALAYTHYPTPAARIRGDSDILIQEDGRERALAALAEAGFVQAYAAGGTVLVAEALIQKQDLAGQFHDIDLHWRLNSAAMINQLFEYEELSGRSVSLELPGIDARRMADIDALLYTCVHRRLHIDSTTHIHLGGVAYPVIDRLCWLLDIHLLYSRLTDEEQRTLIDCARAKRLTEVLADALQSCQGKLGTQVSQDLTAALAGGGSELVSHYLAASSSKRMALNFFATHGPLQKMAFLRELLFPPASYMRRKYADSPQRSLPILYSRRALTGIKKNLLHRRKHS